MTAREARGECVFLCVLWGGSVMVWDEMGSVVIFRRWNQNNMGTGTQFGIRLLTVISIKTHNPVTQYHYCRPDKLLSSEITSWCGNTSGRGQRAGGPGGPGGGPTYWDDSWQGMIDEFIMKKLFSSHPGAHEGGKLFLILTPLLFNIYCVYEGCLYMIRMFYSVCRTHIGFICS